MTHDIDLDALRRYLFDDVPKLIDERDAARAELEQASAEIERLKVERGEALLWSPWNDHDVLFEQWAKRRAGAGNEASCVCHPLVPQDFKDAVAKTAAERYPEKYGALAAGAGDGEQDTATTYEPCGCLTNDEGAHRGGCPVWETRSDGRGRFWTRRTAASVQGAADGEAQAGYHRDARGAVWPDACTCGGRVGAYCPHCNPGKEATA